MAFTLALAPYADASTRLLPPTQKLAYYVIEAATLTPLRILYAEITPRCQAPPLVGCRYASAAIEPRQPLREMFHDGRDRNRIEPRSTKACHTIYTPACRFSRHAAGIAGCFAAAIVRRRYLVDTLHQ